VQPGTTTQFINVSPLLNVNTVREHRSALCERQDFDVYSIPKNCFPTSGSLVNENILHRQLMSLPASLVIQD
jgi:hypothetical protein